MPRGTGAIQKKILLLLGSGLALSFARSPRAYFRVVKDTAEEWKKINRYSLRKAIKSLYNSKLVNWVENHDGSVTLTLTDKGKNKSLTCDLDNLKIDKPKKWDKKWHVIAFDIPEKHRKARDALRLHLRQMGFYELQKSVFVYPYPCTQIMDFLIEFYNIRRNVRQILAEDLDNSLDLKDRFNLI